MGAGKELSEAFSKLGKKPSARHCGEPAMESRVENGWCSREGMQRKPDNKGKRRKVEVLAGTQEKKNKCDVTVGELETGLWGGKGTPNAIIRPRVLRVVPSFWGRGRKTWKGHFWDYSSQHPHTREATGKQSPPKHFPPTPLSSGFRDLAPRILNTSARRTKRAVLR